MYVLYLLKAFRQAWRVLYTTVGAQQRVQQFAEKAVGPASGYKSRGSSKSLPKRSSSKLLQQQQVQQVTAKAVGPAGGYKCKWQQKQRLQQVPPKARFQQVAAKAVGLASGYKSRGSSKSLPKRGSSKSLQKQ